jgi:Ca2+-binding EF-hand superfamily protein/WD40 repeat protein
MDIMMRLKGAGFSAIANAFREREKRLDGGLPLLDFVEIVLPGLPRPKTAEEKAASVSALVDLFEDIDINGDGVMEFDEFTSFCVDAGMVATRTQVATLKHRYERDAKHALKTTAAVAPVANASSRGPTSNSSVLNPQSTSIEKLKWSAGFRMFLVLENAARSVKIFTSEGKFVTEVSVGGDKQTPTSGSPSGSSPGLPLNDVLVVGAGADVVPPPSAAPPSASSVSILDAVFIHRFQWLGVSTTDFAISFYDMSDSKKNASTSSAASSTTFALLKNLGLTTTTAQLMLRFCESSALLVGSGNDFVLNVWKVVDVETKVLWHRLSSHADLVLDALEIPAHDLMASCDLRHCIQLWDINDGRSRGSLNAHERGVRQLCYSEQHDLLLSAGFEFEALAWDLGSRQVALKLSGHRAPLIGVQLTLFQTERAITGDSQGVFKVWDITRGTANSSASSTSHAVQLESVDLGMPSLHVEPIAFVSMHPCSRDLWVATSGSCTLQHLRSVRVQQFDEVPLQAFYHYSANKFVVVAGSVCSLWDGETGSCSEEFTHVGNLGVHCAASGAAGAGNGGSSKKDAVAMATPSPFARPAPSDAATLTSRSTQPSRNEPGTELLTCAHDVKCRKLVVVSEQGALGVFNCQNFVQMRQCQESFLSKTRLQGRASVSKTLPTTSSAPSCAVVGLHYCSRNKLIVVTDAGTSAIFVIDDDSNQDSSKGIGILRRLVNIPGGIAASAYNFHASMVATAAADPDGMRISLWDFETLAHLGDCRYDQDGTSSKATGKDESSLSIQVLEFWDEFPVLVAGDSVGGVYFFAVTSLLHAYAGKLLHAFVNDHDASGSGSRRRTRTKPSRGIHASFNENEEDEGSDDDRAEAEAIKEVAENAARKLLLSSKNFRKNALTSAPVLKPETEATAKSPMEAASAVTCLKVAFDEDSDRYLLFVGDERGCVGVWDPAAMMRRLALAKIPEIKCKHLRRGYQPKATFYRDFSKEAAGVDGRRLPNQSDKHRQAVSHGASDWRGAMLLGEDMEHMNVRASHMDLKRLSRRRQESRAQRPVTPSAASAAKLSAPLNPKNASPARAKETAVVNAVAAAEFLLSKGSAFALPKHQSGRGPSTSEAAAEKTWPGSTCYDNFPRDVALVRRWQAHADALTSLELSRHPNIVVTCGLDMRVFVWDWDGACLGKLFDPENQGPWPWRFRKDNATRTKERDVLVRDLLQELERTPAEKMELRRQTLYAEHVGRRNVSELRNVNAMLLEHIISKNPEIKLLEQEILASKALAEASSSAAKMSKFRASRAKKGTLRTLALLPTKTKAALPTPKTPRQALRLQSLSQAGPLLHEEVLGRKASAAASDEPAFLEPGDLKMDKAYLEKELSITCPTSSSSPLNLSRDSDVRQQIQAEYQLAQEAIATRATLTRKAKEMYCNLEGVRNRSSNHHPPSPDRIDQAGDALEPSAFLKRHFPASALAMRPQTAPIRALSNSASVGHVGSRRSETAPHALQVSASDSTLPLATPLRKPSSAGHGAMRRRSSLDEVYMEEFNRHRQQQRRHKERAPNASVSEETVVDGGKLHAKPLHKLHEINGIIDKVHGFCNDAAGRPGTAPIVARHSVSLSAAAVDESVPVEQSVGMDAQVLRRHLEDTKQRMQEALREDKRIPHRQNLRRLRQQAQQQLQKRRMNGYLQQKRRELTTNIGNVFKGLQTAAGPEEGGEQGEADDVGEQGTAKGGSRKSQQRSSTTGLLKSKTPKPLAARKTFGMYSVQEVMSVIRLFWSMDADGSGNISMSELQRYKPMFEKLGYPNLAAIFQAIDANGDGQVSLRELLATCFHYATKQQLDGMLQLAKVGNVRSFLLGTSGSADKDGRSSVPSGTPFAGGKLLPEHRSEMMAIFRVFDRNGDGGVSMQEIMEALRVDDDDVMAAVMTREHDKAGQRPAGRSAEPVVSSGLTREDVEQLYREFDRDKDATLDFDEFVAVMASLCVTSRACIGSPPASVASTSGIPCHE